MSKRGSTVALVLLLCSLLLAPTAQANEAPARYVLDWHVLGAGAGPSMSNSSHALGSTLGQTAIGWSVNGRRLGSGFWYGVSGRYEVFLPLVLRGHA